MKPEETYRVILGLVLMNDWDIFGQVARTHPEDFPPAHREELKEIGDTLESLVREYEFTKSPDFQQPVEWRSSEFVKTKLRLESEPVKRKKHRERFVVALRAFPISRDAFDLLDPERHQSLNRIEEILQSLPPGV